MQSDNASPRPNSRPQQHRAPRHHNNQHIPETQSDSNLPATHTPKPKKTPRQHAQTAQGNRHPNTNANPRSRPASGAVPVAATPSKPTYAGAAFHASPAPSSLPVPKFFSKSVPSANADAGLQAKLEREGERPDSRASPGPGFRLAPAAAGGSSQLDAFFNADRQEKARLQCGPNGQQYAPADSRSQTPSRAKDMFMLELDESQSPVPSQHSTPIPFNRQTANPAMRPLSENTPNKDSEEARRAAQTQSLKAFLNITSAEASSTPPQLPRQPVQHQQAPYSTPSHPGAQQPHNLLYGNRNLSPLFQAARTPNGAAPHGQAQPYNPGNYASVYGDNQYLASPSRPPASHSHPFQNSPQPPRGAPYGMPQSHGPPQPQYPPSNGANDVQDMEERMKRLLRMS